MDVPLERRRHRGPLLAALGAGITLVGVTAALTRLSQAPPTVERSAVWIDTVRRGELLREVGGPGTLVPEEIRWITARTAGSVERVHVEPGSAVKAETVLLELANPDVQYTALETERQHRSSEAKLADLRAQLEMEQLNHEAVLASARVQYREAERRAEASQRMFDREIVGEIEYAESQERAQELALKLDIETRRAAALQRSMTARLEAQEAEVGRLEALARFHRQQLESLHVRAGSGGVLQELPLEVGQQVAPGDLLAKVVEPTRLKAELRIPESQARDVALGQEAQIDTRGAVIEGRVTRIDPAVQNGTVTVDVELIGALPQGARPDLSVDGRIRLERLEDVLFTGRPAFGQAHTQVSLFRVGNGDVAERVKVSLGGSSVSHVQVVEGLDEGDRVILSDMTEWDAVDRVRLN